MALGWGFTSPVVASSATELGRGLHEAGEFYLRWHSVEGHTEQKIESCRKRLQMFCRFMAESRASGLLLEQVRPLDAPAYLEAMKARGCAPAMLRGHFLTLRAWFA